jgi:hypothetical protein
VKKKKTTTIAITLFFMTSFFGNVSAQTYTLANVAGLWMKTGIYLTHMPEKFRQTSYKPGCNYIKISADGKCREFLRFPKNSSDKDCYASKMEQEITEECSVKNNVLIRKKTTTFDIITVNSTRLDLRLPNTQDTIQFERVEKILMN